MHCLRWFAVDLPTNANTLPIIPIQNDRPCESQPPIFTKVVKISFASPFGPSTNKGIKIAKKPRICSTKSAPSNLGSSHPAATLMNTQKAMTAQYSNVTCQFCGTYVSGWHSISRPWMSPPVRKAPEPSEASHPHSVSQPEM